MDAQMLTEIVFIGKIAVKSSVAVALAGLGEVWAERAGVLNLGVEGMMLCGALCGFAAGLATGNPWLAVAGGMLAGGLLALLHGFFAITLRVNQVLSGLALTLLGTGLANFLGRAYTGARGVRIRPYKLPGLEEIPLLGEVFFQQSAIAYAAYLLVPLSAYLLYRTRWGLTVRACGEDAQSADAMGAPVARTRYLAVVAGGLLAGLAGAYLSLSYTPGYKESMTAGQGWIAIAMVIFAGWDPLRVFAGALFFGFLTALQFYFQATGEALVPAYILKMLPYLLTMGVLCLGPLRLPGRRRGARKPGSAGPGSLGRPFSRG